MATKTIEKDEKATWEARKAMYAECEKLGEIGKAALRHDKDPNRSCSVRDEKDDKFNVRFGGLTFDEARKIVDAVAAALKR